MLWRWAAALAIASATSVSAQSLDAVPVPASEDAAEIIALERDLYRRLTVPVTIEGQGPFRFLIDTGSQATVLSRELADHLSLTERQSAVLVGAASRVPVETTAVRALGLGSRTFDIPLAPLVEGRHLGGDAQGILGVDSLQNQRVLLDFVTSRITVADAADLGGNRGFEIIVRARRKLGQLIITRAELDGVRVAVIVDTGAGGSTGNSALLRKLRRAQVAGSARMTDVNGYTVDGTMYLGKELSFGRARLRNLAILVEDSPAFEALGLSDEPALVLGMAELRLFRRVAIDFKAQRILFDLPADRTGVSFFNLTPQ